ncbi:alcohol dehydrogenase [Mesorhizobium sp. M3A.F.Ca.ET.174.01.1.1]|nr:alcohol dehydrogenase [Mesorhizobium sp. M3A.F.Ca.ET.080.04.2.1]PBB86314.1 alcohol dehydrogenase [Mesorhizobium sp. WSM3876]RWB66759.1 MAG: alcohol dehydrogenase [Mesorhizobium sp.]TGS64279.1 alcohol dehydrogenase [Mesorhizobium sp. M3A.F.Ca.ET.201.01.1.1]TGS86001.1 alcohol dehydrogenase [Mesorhizobium sp. M3A.F.Ca.ET.175.01.1.1]TGT23934.1 alcohol dehydrogenase [Mesorhizobium sp. M3A.F.Ca.ET.174.01.1.1]TGT57482.1 alcohol dehydrogenase [Mesorhizobium sp. M00.F.Ca.ET.170.01.1.1]
MMGVVLVGHGGFDKLEFRTDLPVPTPAAGEVLIRVSAASVNNTDINTRIGWYSKAVTSGTDSGARQGFASAQDDDTSWSGVPLAFPRIQGADCCGHIAAVGEGVSRDRIGERVIVRNLLRTYVNYRPFECWTFGSECDGGFAQYTKAPSRETFKVDCDWSDNELAAMPCAYSTAEGMLHRASVEAGEHVVITGASGGVGSAAVQLAKRRGAYVTAIAGRQKAQLLLDLGADQVVARGENLVARLGKEAVDVAIDVAAGPGFPALLDVLKKGGRYAVAGAIAGPLVELDIRTLYLKDLTFFGCTFQEDIVFDNLVSYIERGEIRPVVAKTYRLEEIAKAQQDFLSKSIVGKIVLEIPA